MAISDWTFYGLESDFKTDRRIYLTETQVIGYMLLISWAESLSYWTQIIKVHGFVELSFELGQNYFLILSSEAEYQLFFCFLLSFLGLMRLDWMR